MLKNTNNAVVKRMARHSLKTGRRRTATLFLAVFHALKRENPALSDDSVFRLRFALSDEFTEIRVIGISEP